MNILNFTSSLLFTFFRFYKNSVSIVNLPKALSFLMFVFLMGLGLSGCNYVKGLLGQQTVHDEVVVAKSSEIKLIASNDKFKFIPHQIIAKPGQVLKLKVINQIKAMPIVFSVLKKDEDPVVNAFLGMQKGKEGNWAPPIEHILVGSKLLGFGEFESFEIKLPNEPGTYAFISSYPGQVDDLHGSIKIELAQD